MKQRFLAIDEIFCLTRSMQFVKFNEDSLYAKWRYSQNFITATDYNRKNICAETH